MNKLFNFARAKGKWHKFPSFNLGGGAKLYKNFAQKLLAVSLCMAVVLLGVPRGQNFVAEAADEATKSVALLTLTATGDKDEPVTADMTWKRFIPGTTVDLVIRSVSAAGSLVSSVRFSDWFAAWGALTPLAPGWVSPVPLSGWLAAGRYSARLSTLWDPLDRHHGLVLFASGAGHYSSTAAPLLSLCDVVPPLVFVVRGPIDSGFALAPGLARVYVGGSVSAPLDVLFGDDVDPVSVTSSAPSVAVYEGGAIQGLSAGTATLTFTQEGSVCGTVEVAVGDRVPPYEVPAGLTAVAGTRLGDVVLPAPTDAGAWAWVHPDDLLTTPGTTTHKALYTPTDRIQYDPVEIDVPVEVYLEQTVTVKGKTQRLRVYNPNNVLPADTTFTAEYVDGTHGDHNFFITHLDPTKDVELRHYYNLTLASGGQTLSQLDGPIELWFEAIDGIDAPDSFISRVAEGADDKLEPTLYTDDDGITWIKVLTDHFSPYALTDLLSAEEKAVLGNVKTGDLATQITVAGLGMTLVLALGIMLRLITNKRKFEE